MQKAASQDSLAKLLEHLSRFTGPAPVKESQVQRPANFQETIRFQNLNTLVDEADEEQAVLGPRAAAQQVQKSPDIKKISFKLDNTQLDRSQSLALAVDDAEIRESEMEESILKSFGDFAKSQSKDVAHEKFPEFDDLPSEKASNLNEVRGSQLILGQSLHSSRFELRENELLDFDNLEGLQDIPQQLNSDRMQYNAGDQRVGSNLQKSAGKADFNKVHKINLGEIKNALNDDNPIKGNESQRKKSILNSSIAMSNHIKNFDDFDLEDDKPYKEGVLADEDLLEDVLDLSRQQIQHSSRLKNLENKQKKISENKFMNDLSGFASSRIHSTSRILESQASLASIKQPN